MVRWGIGVPAHLAGASRESVLQYARRAESLGFDSVWVGDRIVFDNLDPLLTLAALAAATETVELAPTTFIAPARSPVEVAKFFATLDVLSAGRCRPVLSVGHRPDDYAATGRAYAGRGDALDEMITILRTAWAADAIVFHGRHYDLDLAPVGPRPVREGGLPLWFGGDSPRARKRAVMHGAGHMSGTAGRDKTRALPADFRALCASLGRDYRSFGLGATAYFALGSDPQLALDQGMTNLLPYYRTLHWDPVIDVIWGPRDAAARRIVDYGALDMETFVFVPSAFDVDQLDMLRDVVDRIEAVS